MTSLLVDAGKKDMEATEMEAMVAQLTMNSLLLSSTMEYWRLVSEP